MGAFRAVFSFCVASLCRRFLRVCGEDTWRWDAAYLEVYGEVLQDSTDEEVMCPERGCNAEFRHAPALASHRSLAHGWRHPLRSFIVGSICPVCKIDFRSRLRCLAHVQRSNVYCRTQLEAGAVPEAAPEALAQADADEQAFRVACRVHGVSLLAGPRCIPPEEV